MLKVSLLGTSGLKTPVDFQRRPPVKRKRPVTELDQRLMAMAHATASARVLSIAGEPTTFLE